MRAFTKRYLRNSFETRDGAGLDSTNEEDLSYDPLGGLGFFPRGFVLDTHFGQRGREGRLIRLLADTKDIPKLGAIVGIGVDENTALHVTVNEEQQLLTGRVIGPGGVFLPNVTMSTVDSDGLWTADNVRAHYVKEGDLVDLTNWKVLEYASWKADLEGEEWHEDALSSDDIFDGNRHHDEPELPMIASRLFDS